MQEKKNDKLVVKHNKLIEFKGRMTTNELKLFSLIIADVREQQDKQFQEYNIDISVLEEITKDKNFYNYIQEVALRLEDKRIIVEGLNEKNKRHFTTIRLINKPRYTEGSNKLTVDIDKDLIPYIIDLKREFTRYQIENILRLKSSYSVRVYELLKQYEGIGKREIGIDDFRDYLGINKDEYIRFYDFERRILIQSKTEINGEIDKKGNIIYPGTDINIDYEKIKTGRRITSILFTIEPKDQDQYIVYLNQYYNIKDLKIKMGLSNENFNSKQVMNIYEKAIEKVQDQFNPMEYVRLNYIHVKAKGSARNPYSYLMAALENDYGAAAGQLRLFDMI